MLRRYKLTIFTIILCVTVGVYFFRIIYACHLLGIYPVKPQVNTVSIEYHGAWLPMASNEVPIWDIYKFDKSRPATLFYKLEGVKPFPQGTILIMWLGDKYTEVSNTDEIYSQTIHFDWGTANIIKKELTADPSAVVAVVPEFKILINAESLDQLKEIKSITKIQK